MQTFLSTVVDQLIEQEQNLSNLIIVLPSRRAGGILRNTLSRKLKKTIFSPTIYSIENFIEHVSGLKSIDQTAQLFTLYDVYCTAEPQETRESFATFYGWAQTLLHDFNEIDRYLVDQKKCFAYLSAIQEVNHWSTAKDQTEIVKRYLHFWNKLPLYYEAFAEKLIAQNKGHQGLVYRKAAEDVEFYIENHKNQRHIFLGFNALNTAEQHIIQAILENGNADIFWDADKWFTKHPSHEAAMFMKSYQKEWSYFQKQDFKWIAQNYEQPKNIKVTAVSQNIEQAKYIGEILKKYTPEQLNNTALVLSDESLLAPILNALPPNVAKLNITMGMPLRQTPTASLFESLFNAHKQYKSTGFYHKNVIAIIEHPTLSDLLTDSVLSITGMITEKNRIFISKEELLQKAQSPIAKQLLELLFNSWNESPQKAIDCCIETIGLLRAHLQESKSTSINLQLEYLFGFFKAFNSLKLLNDSYSYISDIPMLWRFYKDVLSAETLDLQGDPYEGLQVMGMLESRLLDFENLIITSVNEGILPAGKSTNSYIPFDVKAAYKLPTYREKDAVYTYHFYRLLHRAQNVDILYTTSADGLGSTERSRFLLQLEIEGPHQIIKAQASPAFKPIEHIAQCIEKTPAVMAKLEQLAAYGFSPSSLTTYIRNPLDFYYKYVLGVKQSEDVEETVAANTMGTIVHNTLEELYKPIVNAQLTLEVLQALYPKIEQEVSKQFKKEYSDLQITQGKNLIIYEVVCRFVKNYLLQEERKITRGDLLYIRSLEANLNVAFPSERLVRLKGKVDLVEERNGTTYIIDYKTGRVEQRHLKPTHWEDLLNHEGKFEKAFQVLMYAYMMHSQAALKFPVKAGIVSFKNLKQGFIPFTWEKQTDITLDTLNSFEAILNKAIAEIFDPEIPFQEKNSDYKK